MCNLHIFRQLIMNKKIKSKIHKELKFPYYKRIRTREGLIVERVANKKDEKRLKKYFPESFENNK